MIRKQFHKALIAILCHPASDKNAITYENNEPSSNNSSRTLPMADGGEETLDTHARRPSTFSMEVANILSRTTITEKMKAFLQVFTDGKLSGIPLLAYVSHIIWQCRPLEEYFDFAHDRKYPSMHHPTFNITTILAADSLIQQSFHTGSDHTSTSRDSEEIFRYHRVLFALISTSLCLDLLVTHLVVKYFRGLYAANQTTPSSSVLQALDKAIDRGICSLTPLCSALLVIYTEYFPQTSISVLPFLNTTRFGIGSSVLGYILAYIILTLLSSRSYPLMGMLCGSMSGFLWINGLTTFLAGSYSGNCLILFVLLLSAISYKVQYFNAVRTRRTRTLPIIDWLPCIESVLWDENGNFPGIE